MSIACPHEIPFPCDSLVLGHFNPSSMHLIAGDKSAGLQLTV